MHYKLRRQHLSAICNVFIEFANNTTPSHAPAITELPDETKAAVAYSGYAIPLLNR